MARTSVPKNYVISEGTLLADFETIGNYTVTGATMEVDTTTFRSGSQGIKVTSIAGGTAVLDRVVSWDLSDMYTFHQWVYIQDPNKIAGMTVYFTNDNFASWFSKDVGGAAGSLKKGWNLLRINRNEWVKGGNMTSNWSNPMIKVRLRFVAKSGEIGVCTWDDMKKNPVNIPNVVFTFDDGFKSTLTLAYPILESYGIKGTVWAIADTADGTDPNYMRKADLDTLYAAGWDIGSHTKTHRDLSTLTDAEIYNELSYTKKWLNANGYSRSANYVAYPVGGYDDRVIEACKSLGIKAARSTNFGIQPMPYENIYNLRTLGTDNTTTLATVKGWIDDTIISGGTLFVMVHDVASSASGAATLTSILDGAGMYCKDRKVNTPTFSKWDNGLTNPRL